MIANIAQNILFIGMVTTALFCLVSGLNTLRQHKTTLWFNQPYILLGMGLIFFALLDFTLSIFREHSLDKLFALPCLILFFLSLTFFLFRSLFLFVRNFS